MQKPSDPQNQLPIPPGCKDPGSIEILRCWIRGSNKTTICIFDTDAWKEIGTWGILLADIARHIGNAIEKEKGIPAAHTVLRIYEMFKNEMKDPTDTPELIDKLNPKDN